MLTFVNKADDLQAQHTEPGPDRTAIQDLAAKDRFVRLDRDYDKQFFTGKLCIDHDAKPGGREILGYGWKGVIEDRRAFDERT